MAPGSGKIPIFLGLGNFVGVRTLGGGLGDTVSRSSQEALRHAATRGCQGRWFCFEPVEGQRLKSFDRNTLPV
jgi:hypothetical protein